MKIKYYGPQGENISDFSNESLPRDLSIIIFSLENGSFSPLLSAKSDEAHIIHNGYSPDRDIHNGTKESRGTYLVNFFEQIPQGKGLVSKGFQHLSPKDIEYLAKNFFSV